MTHVHTWFPIGLVFTGQDILNVRYCICGVREEKSWIPIIPDEPLDN